MTTAYSYLRFSSPEQERGDSHRRQAELVRLYAAKQGLELDESTTYRDLGVSAYRNRHAKTGALSDFLAAVDNGIVAKGSYLLVESLDRLSRDDILEAQAIFTQIINRGITLVTLSDNREYSRESITANPTELIVSILMMMRAHEESATKGKRVRAAWKQKRADGGTKKLTKLCPAWLKMSEDRAKFEVMRDRADVVRRIYRMTLKGTGQNLVARTLNEEKVPAFKGEYWHRSYVAKLLANPAVVGTFVPHTEEYENGRTIRKPQEPITGYFPPIVTKDAYERVRALREGAADPRRGRHAAAPVNNILGGLGRCPRCGSTMTVTNKSSHGSTWRYFVCTKAKAGAGCTYRTVRYGDIERAVLRDYVRISAECPSPTAQGREIEGHLDKLQANIEGAESALEELIRAVESGSRSPTLRKRIQEVEAALDEMRSEERGYFSRLAATSSKALQIKLERTGTLLAAPTLDRQAANTALRQLLAKVVINHDEGVLTFHWLHGGESELAYSWFEKEPKEKQIKRTSAGTPR